MSRACPLPNPIRQKAAIFDFDGTLADTAGLWHKVDRQFLSARGIPLTPDYAQRLSSLGFVEGARYTIERYGLDETVEEVCAEWTDLSRTIYQTEVTLRPGALRYLTHLRAQGVRCALATINSLEVLGGMRNIAVEELFDACVFGEDTTRGKDHPDIYLEAASRLGVDPPSCIVFEDIVAGVRSARRAGMSTCGVRAHDPSQEVAKLMEASDYWVEDWRGCL